MIAGIFKQKENSMSELKSCPKGAEHKAHMCQLKHEGRIEEMDKHSAQPKFVCNKCGAKADEEGYLCNPRPI